MNATQTYVNIAPTASCLRFMPHEEFPASHGTNYTTASFGKARGHGIEKRRRALHVGTLASRKAAA